MKHIKTFENLNLLEKEKKLSLVAIYLEEIMPVTEEDGFIECLYDDEPNIFSFYFYDWTEDESYNKFYKFLKENRLKIKNERPSGDRWELNVIISDKTHSDKHLLYADWIKRDSTLVKRADFEKDIKSNYQIM